MRSTSLLPAICALILVPLMLPALAQARLGESPDLIGLRFGKVVDTTQTKDGQTQNRYQHGGLDIWVNFKDGASVCEYYTRNPKDLMGAALYGPNEIESFLAANADGAEWLYVSAGALSGAKADIGNIFKAMSGDAAANGSWFERSDKKAMATLTPFALMIYTL